MGILVDASKLWEPDGLETLLPLLFELWPDVPIETIVGDKIYDENGAHEFCAVQMLADQRGLSHTPVRRAA